MKVYLAINVQCTHRITAANEVDSFLSSSDDGHHAAVMFMFAWCIFNFYPDAELTQTKKEIRRNSTEKKHTEKGNKEK